MFLTTSLRVQQRFLFFFLVSGLFLRILGLFYFPPGMEGDEVVVVYWGRKWITEGQWLLISHGELPAWETPAAYFFGALDLMGIPPRIGAVTISFVEIFFCYLWVRRRGDPTLGLLAASFLSLMPWHFYFSYVLGPCVAGLWTSLYLLDVRNPLGRILITLGGLFYYVSFRVTLFWGGLVHLWRRRWALLVVDILGGLFALAILWLVGGAEQLREFFTKGSYLVVQRGPLEWLHHYLNSLFLWWLPPLQVYWHRLTMYSMDDVGFGLANSLGFQSPLSWGTAIFFGWGLYLCFKKKEHQDLLGLFLLAVVLVGFSPSYVHFPFILPVVAFIAARGGQALLGKKNGFLVLITSLLVSLASVVYVMTSMKANDRWGTFSGKTEMLVAAIPPEATNQKFVWTAGEMYYSARLAADRADIPLVGFSRSHAVWLSVLQSQMRRSNMHWVFVQATGRLNHPRPEKEVLLREAHADYLKRLAFFETNSNVRNKKPIMLDGEEMGILYELVP